ncbi:hypothetical protein [Rhizobium mesoamericanum]|uniref:Uncharacterized protein n=1 Tax=Rhizobium mesoamericanum STM3625 TaxID=1211777 RepID=K0PZ55_9HYPH|nr:hypothetical protein [Rhizobium mesoamericanum]CCM76737.1 hypothetical protein BN77_3766 [Rhizobium mesoamericanum STM3625]
MTEAAKTAENFATAFNAAGQNSAIACSNLYPLSICFVPDKEVRDQQPVNR